MRPVKIIMLVLGALATLTAFALAAAGAPLTAAHFLLRDDAGYYSTGTERLTTPGQAIISEPLELTAEVSTGDWAGLADELADELGTLRATAQPQGAGDVFIGVAPTADVRAYLAGSTYDVVLGFDRAGGPLFQRHTGGQVTPAPPASQDFWVASTQGTGSRTVTWDVSSGDWTVVVMNADARPGVDVTTSVGLRTDVLLPIGLGLLGAAAAAFLIAGALLVLAVSGNTAGSPRGIGNGATPATSAGADPVPAAASSAGALPAPLAATPATEEASRAPVGPVRAGTYPARLDARLDPGLSRWLWLVKWILVLPHVLILALLWPVFLVLTAVAGVCILVTGRYPRSIFDVTVGILRWHWRVTYYAVTLGTDRYPPFSLRPDPTYPADLQVDYPITCRDRWFWSSGGSSPCRTT